MASRQRPGQSYRPAGSNNNYQGQDYMFYFNFGKEPLDKTGIYPKNSYKESQKRHNDHDRAQKCNGRLCIKRTIMTKDFAPCKLIYRSGHSTSWTRQAVFFLKTTAVRREADSIMCSQPQQSEESNHRQEKNGSSNSLATRCPAENFRFI